eukprot:13395527-Alexandrium_andersonii.AAC.1
MPRRARHNARLCKELAAVYAAQSCGKGLFPTYTSQRPRKHSKPTVRPRAGRVHVRPHRSGDQPLQTRPVFRQRTPAALELIRIAAGHRPLTSDSRLQRPQWLRAVQTMKNIHLSRPPRHLNDPMGNNTQTRTRQQRRALMTALQRQSKG